MTEPQPACPKRDWMASIVAPIRTGHVDTVCPNFYVLAHAKGCNFQPQCAYCYLRDTTQYPPGNILNRDPEAMADEVVRWINTDDLLSYVLNTGNLSDSLCFEDLRPAMAGLVELFRVHAEARGRPHTLLLVTKGGLRHCAELLKIAPCRNVIVSFSLNTPAAAAEHEAGAAAPADRLAAAERLLQAGWRVRLRIDPMIQGYDYSELVEQVKQLRPERVTIGALRADGQLVKHVAPDVMAGVAPPHGPDGVWQYPREERLAMYRPVVEALRGTCSIGLCEEWPDIWQALGLPVSEKTCNCNHL